MTGTPLNLTPMSRFRVQVALDQHRIRRAEYMRNTVVLTLTDGTLLQLASEAEVLIALRCLTSAAHAGMSPEQARAAERSAAASTSRHEKVSR